MGTGAIRFRRGLWAGLAAAALLLAACGSDDDGDVANAAEIDEQANDTTTTPDQADVVEYGETGDHEHAAGEAPPEVELRDAMRKLWADHMQWTYATVDAFFHNADALEPTLNRLLRNQADIGAAIVPYYGQEAGDALTELLTGHINGAVLV